MRTADFAACVHVALAHQAGQPPLSQAEFSQRVDMSLEEMIRNWAQGKRCPTGAASASLEVLDEAPEAALAALH